MSFIGLSNVAFCIVLAGLSITGASACETSDCTPCAPGSVPLEQSIRESFIKSSINPVDNPLDDPLDGGTGTRGAVAAIPISIAGFAFNPPQLIIPTAAAVRWTQSDFTTHTASSTSPVSAFNSGFLGNGATFQHTFATVGAFPYKCQIHPFMVGAVEVRLPGDADGSNAVNLDDFTTLAANFGTTGRTYVDGDFTVDGSVNLDDFTVLAANFGTTLPRSTVPEPASAMLFWVGAILLRRRK
mgnify:CR=1 FL=1